MKKLLLFSLLTGLTAFAGRAGALQASAPPTIQPIDDTDGRADRELFDKALHGGIGKCYVSDARHCKTCFADYYVKSSIVRWSGKGWPLNPQSKDSTGAVVPAKNRNYFCWNGYSRDMCTRTRSAEQDVVRNAAAQLRSAIKDRSNPCGLCTGKNCTAVHNPNNNSPL